MRRIIATTFVSLDGVMQAPGGPDEDTTGGFAFGGWTFPYFDEASGSALFEIFSKPFDLLLGRRTYDIFASYWPLRDDHPIGALFNKVTKYVATRGNGPLDWQNSQSLGGDTVARLHEIKEGEGPDLLVQGSGDFIQTLLRHGLIDEHTLMTFPVVLGGGKKLFGDDIAPSAMTLIRSQSFATGVIMATYRPSGAVRTGSFAEQEPCQNK